MIANFGDQVELSGSYSGGTFLASTLRFADDNGSPAAPGPSTPVPSTGDLGVVTIYGTVSQTLADGPQLVLRDTQNGNRPIRVYALEDLPVRMRTGTYTTAMQLHLNESVVIKAYRDGSGNYIAQTIWFRCGCGVSGVGGRRSALRRRLPTHTLIIWNNNPSRNVEHDAMEKPVRRTLLPGVSDAEAPPLVITNSRAVVARARRRAIVRDVIDLLLLVCVDGLFLRWPLAHVPFLDRYDSLLVLLGLNAMLAGYFWLARAVPRWTASRVAATWSLPERASFFRR